MTLIVDPSHWMHPNMIMPVKYSFALRNPRHFDDKLRYIQQDMALDLICHCHTFFVHKTHCAEIIFLFVFNSVLVYLFGRITSQF